MSLAKSALPNDLQAEKHALGAMLMDVVAAGHLFEELEEDDFLSLKNRTVFAAAKELFEAGKEINLMSVQERLNQLQKLDKIGGLYYLSELVEMTASSAMVESAVSIVKDKAVCRKIMEIAQKLQVEAINPSMTSQEILEIAEEKIFGLAQQKMTNKIITMRDILPQVVDMIEMQYKHPGALLGLPTGINTLDVYISGLQRQQFIVLAGDTRAGKSALALNTAFHLVQKGKKVAYFSFEMSAFELANRMICAKAEVDSYKVRCGRISEIQLKHILNTAAALYDNKLLINDSAAMTITQIRSQARKLKAMEDIDLLIIDYLQQVIPVGKHDTRAEAVASLSRGFKCIAKELDIPVLALSQLKRTNTERPRLHDLKESSGIEQDSDVVLFVHRPSLAKEVPDPDPEDAEIIIGKQRSGPADIICNVKFHKGRTEWSDVDKYHDNEKHLIPEAMEIPF